MTEEKWIQWNPLKGIPRTLYLNRLKYSYNGLTLDLNGKDSTKNLTIHFDGFFGCRFTSKNSLLKNSSETNNIILEIEKILGFSGSLFTVDNSRYLQWFHYQSLNVRETTKITHYVIRTPDEIVEVLDSEIPTFIWN